MRRGFTLIELLVVIAIIAILAVVVVLTLNPGQLILQARDSTRVSDLASLQDAIGLYITDAAVNGTVSLGSANTVYVSIPDPTATSTLGDQCQGLGLLSLPTGYAYHCAASSTFRMNDGTGWIPINWKSMSQGGVLGQLPQDPVNSSSSRTYETYTTDGTQYELTTALESSKYKLGGTNDIVGPDGATLSTAYAKGTNLTLEPLDYGDSSLVGLWTFDEGANSIAYDYSGNNATGSWQGTLGNQFVAGKVGPYAGNFNGSNNIVRVPDYSAIDFATGTPFSYSLWFNSGSISTLQGLMGKTGAAYSGYGGLILLSGSQLYDQISSYPYNQGTVLSNNTWYYATIVWNGTQLYLYINGQSSAPITPTVAPFNVSVPLAIGNFIAGGGNFFNGLIDDVRIYNRALSASEIQAMYNGGK